MHPDLKRRSPFLTSCERILIVCELIVSEKRKGIPTKKIKTTELRTGRSNPRTRISSFSCARSARSPAVLSKNTTTAHVHPCFIRPLWRHNRDSFLQIRLDVE